MLGVEGNYNNLVVEISPIKPNLGGSTGGLKEGTHKGAEKGSGGKLSSATNRQAMN